MEFPLNAKSYSKGYWGHHHMPWGNIRTLFTLWQRRYFSIPLVFFCVFLFFTRLIQHRTLHVDPGFHLYMPKDSSLRHCALHLCQCECHREYARPINWLPMAIVWCVTPTKRRQYDISLLLYFSGYDPRQITTAHVAHIAYIYSNITDKSHNVSARYSREGNMFACIIICGALPLQIKCERQKTGTVPYSIQRSIHTKVLIRKTLSSMHFL